MEKMNWIRKFTHNMLGLHKPKGMTVSNGVTTSSHCKYCGKHIMRDSQGNWF